MSPVDMNINLAPRDTITDNLVFIGGLMRTVKQLAAGIATTFPVIGSGGTGAVTAANIFHFTEQTQRKEKLHLKEQEFPMRVE